jgi:hypothetical protein
MLNEFGRNSLTRGQVIFLHCKLLILCMLLLKECIFNGRVKRSSSFSGMSYEFTFIVISLAGFEGHSHLKT